MKRNDAGHEIEDELPSIEEEKEIEGRGYAVNSPPLPALVRVAVTLPAPPAAQASRVAPSPTSIPAVAPPPTARSDHPVQYPSSDDDDDEQVVSESDQEEQEVMDVEDGEDDDEMNAGLDWGDVMEDSSDDEDHLMEIEDMTEDDTSDAEGDEVEADDEMDDEEEANEIEKNKEKRAIKFVFYRTGKINWAAMRRNKEKAKHWETLIKQNLRPRKYDLAFAKKENSKSKLKFSTAKKSGQPQALVWIVTTIVNEKTKEKMEQWEEKLINVGAVVGRRECVSACMNRYKFKTRILNEWFRFTDASFQYIHDGVDRFAVGDVQFKVYDASHPGNWYWLYPDQMFACDDEIAIYTEKHVQVSIQREVEMKMWKDAKEERAREFQERNRMERMSLTVQGKYGVNVVEERVSESESDSDEECYVSMMRCAKERPLLATDRTDEGERARRMARNELFDLAKFEKSAQNGVRADRWTREFVRVGMAKLADWEEQKLHPFGTPEEEDRMLQKQTDEEIEKFALKLWLFTEKYEKPTLDVEGRRETTGAMYLRYCEEWEDTMCIKAEEMWEERKEAILQRRRKEEEEKRRKEEEAKKVEDIEIIELD